MFFPFQFYSSKYKSNIQGKKNWITQGIRISRRKKRELNKLAKQSEDFVFINYVKIYKKVLKSISRETKKITNGSFIKGADNKIKATWDVIKRELGIKVLQNDFLSCLKIDDKSSA